MNKVLTNAFVDELEKTSGLGLALGGALLGGEAGRQASLRLLKGGYMAPLTISSSLGGSVVAQELYNKHKRKKMLRSMSPKQKRALAQNIRDREKILRSGG